MGLPDTARRSLSVASVAEEQDEAGCCHCGAKKRHDYVDRGCRAVVLADLRERDRHDEPETADDHASDKSDDARDES